MRGQASVIGMALFMVGMIFMATLFTGLVAKAVSLLNAGRREAVLLAERAEEDIDVKWSWGRGWAGTYPILTLNNTGSIPLKIVQVRLSIRDRWPHISRGPKVINLNRELAVGAKTKVDTYFYVSRSQVDTSLEKILVKTRMHNLYWLELNHKLMPFILR